jgi:hypothetical protein
MTDYNVSLGNNPYNVVIENNPQFNVGVNYEIPSKSTQYQNEIIQDFAAQFNGTKTTFNLIVNGQPYYPVNEQQLIVSINNIVLEPVVNYTILDNTITFITAPTAGQNFFAVALATTADLTRTINYVIDATPNVVGTGIKGTLTIDVTGTIESWTVLADRVGSLVMDIKKTSYLNYPTFTSIAGTEKPTLSNQAKNKDDGLSTWNTSLNAGDILQFEVESCDYVKQFLIAIKLLL